MVWHIERRNLILGPTDTNEWWTSHAQMPTVMQLEPDLLRVYFAGRDGSNTSRIFAADIALPDMQVRASHFEPVLDLGGPGTFDAHGIGPGTAVREGDRVLLFYSGLLRQEDVPFRPGIGLAVSEDGGRTFVRASDEPVVGASAETPLGATSPTVIRVGEEWWMWYSNYLEWRAVDGKPEPIYDLQCATSRDGLSWTPLPEARIALAGAHEGGLARGAPVRGADGWRMIFASRGWRDFRARGPQSYQLLAATSPDGIHWTREPDGLRYDRPPAPGEWDFQMQAYPSIVPYGDHAYMLYNGNGFGRAGFGYAVLTDAPRAAG